MQRKLRPMPLGQAEGPVPLSPTRSGGQWLGSKHLGELPAHTGPEPEPANLEITCTFPSLPVHSKHSLFSFLNFETGSC